MTTVLTISTHSITNDEDDKRQVGHHLFVLSSLVGSRRCVEQFALSGAS